MIHSEILQTLSVRLNRVWRHLLWLQNDAEQQQHAAPSTAPCSPAPSRCLVIMRNDQPTPPGMFLSFDSILSSASNPSTKTQGSVPKVLTATTPPSASAQIPGKASSGAKRRWGMLKNILPFTNSLSSSSSLRSATLESSAIPSTHAMLPNAQSDSPMTASANLAKVAVYRSHSFKFSLEWFENVNIAGKDRKLYPPKLPAPAQLFLETSGSYPQDNTPLEPKGASAGPSKYTGRALAEWAMLVGECHNFFERRKAEGVPDNSKVETPTLSVEPFRRPG